MVDVQTENLRQPSGGLQCSAYIHYASISINRPWPTSNRCPDSSHAPLRAPRALLGCCLLRRYQKKPTMKLLISTKRNVGRPESMSFAAELSTIFCLLMFKTWAKMRCHRGTNNHAAAMHPSPARNTHIPPRSSSQHRCVSAQKHARSSCRRAQHRTHAAAAWMTGSEGSLKLQMIPARSCHSAALQVRARPPG